MTRIQMFNALNKTAIDLGLEKSWFEIKDISFVPSALTQLSALIFQLDFPQNENTNLIKEQSVNLIKFGKLIFED